METDHSKPSSPPSLTPPPPPSNFLTIPLEEKSNPSHVSPPLSPLSPKPCPLWASHPAPHCPPFQTASMYYQPLQGAPEVKYSLAKKKEPSDSSKNNQKNQKNEKNRSILAPDWIANFPPSVPPPLPTVTVTETETGTGTGIETETVTESMKTQPMEVMSSTTTTTVDGGKNISTDTEFSVDKTSFSLTYGVLEDVAGCFWPYGGLIFDSCIGFRKGKKGQSPLQTADVSISGEKGGRSSVAMEDLKRSRNLSAEAPSRVTVAQLEAATV